MAGKRIRRSRVIGFVKRVFSPTPEKEGYGFITSNVFGLANPEIDSIAFQSMDGGILTNQEGTPHSMRGQ